LLNAGAKLAFLNQQNNNQNREQFTAYNAGKPTNRARLFAEIAAGSWRELLV
jgi:hypothetical protein